MPATPYAFGKMTRTPSLSDRVAEQLTEAIVSRQLRAGDRLPSERELCKEFSVSRTVVREAVRSLAAQGLLRVTSGRGIEVNEINGETVAASLRLLVRSHEDFDYGQVHEVRQALEVLTAGLAAECARPDDLKRLNVLCTEMERGLEARNIAGASEADFQFHRELARLSGNELLLAMLDSISDVLREVRTQAIAQPHVGEEGLRGHRRILKAVSSGNSEAARTAMAEHLSDAERIWRRGARRLGTPGKARAKHTRS